MSLKSVISIVYYGRRVINDIVKIGLINVVRKF